jgi:ferric-dicitrate binding protein FerR (iron transport regulator)
MFRQSALSSILPEYFLSFFGFSLDEFHHSLYYRDMAVIINRIAELIIRYQRKELSAEEEAELTRWMEDSPERQQLFNELTDPGMLKSQLGLMDQYQEASLREKINRGYPNAFQTPVKTAVFRLWPRVAAAVIVLFILGTGTWYFFLDRHQAVAPVQEQLAKDDVAPGGNKATLTLGDGATIILDSAHSGTIAHQGGTTVSKSDSGKLDYSALTQVRDIVYNMLTTPRGGQYKLRLPDGTDVWLNAASSIKYPTAFTGKERKVEVTGEAYFEVARNMAMPFIVQTGEQELKVLGTHFDVNAYTDEGAIRTTLLEGSVILSHADGRVVVKPGEQARLTRGAGFKITPADTEAAVAWKNGFFSFRHANIETVMRQLSRWYDIDVKYEGRISAGLSFSGEIGRSLGLSDVLDGLQLAKIHYRIEGGKKLIILP